MLMLNKHIVLYCIYIYIYIFIIDDETLYNLNIVLSFYPPFDPISALFLTITGMLPANQMEL